MKIALVSDYDRSGGAAIAADRLARGLAALGGELVRFVVWKSDSSPSSVSCASPRVRDQVISNMLRHLGFAAAEGDWRTRARENRILEAVQAFSPDIVNVHNIHGAGLKMRLVRKLCSLGVPVVWTLHDMWPITAGCAYAFGCEAFASESCDENCPRADDYPKMKREHITLEMRRRKRFFEYEGRRVVFVAPSNWLAHEAHRSVVRSNRIEVIANGVDVATLAPLPRAACRDILGISTDANVVLVGGANLDDPRKGWKSLAAALANCRSVPKLHLLVFGETNGVIPDCATTCLGKVNDEKYLSVVYGAANVFVSTALADNLPNVLVEALACGRPSVAFDVGGIRDVVENGVTGFVVSPANETELARKIQAVLHFGLDEQQRISRDCRERSLGRFDSTVQARKYLDLFKSLLDEKAEAAKRNGNTRMWNSLR